jgi:hypothetical protein
MPRFRATIELHGKSATGIEVPSEVVERLAAGRRPPVRVTIGSHSYRTTVASRGGRFLVPLSAEQRAGAGVAAGDEVDVDVELDSEPREVAVPADLAAALDAEPAVRVRFDALPYSHRREHVRAVEEAKAPETRQRRIAKAVAMLRQA